MRFLKKIFSPFCLTLSVLLFVFIFYRSEIHWGGTNKEYYFIYYIISSFFIFFSVITFFINDSIKAYLIVISISLIFTLYVFEGYLFYYLKSDHQLNINKKIKIYKQNTGKDYDLRSIKQIYKDLKKIDPNTVVKVSPGEYLKYENIELFPLSGISNAKTIYQNENGYYMIYKSDRYGFNNPDKEWDEKEIEFFLVGDSFTHGAAVNRPDDIASVLRELSRKPVISVGYSGNGPLIEFGSLIEFLYNNKSLKAKKILWLFTDNDIQGLKYELKSKLLKNYIYEKNFLQNLIFKQDQSDKLATKEIFSAENFKKKFFLIRFFKFYETRNKLFPEKQNNKNNKLVIPKEFKKILERVKNIALKEKSKLYFVYMPSPAMYFDPSYNNNIRREVIKIINDLKLNLIDIHALVSENEKNIKKLYALEMYGHYNVKGYKKVAEAIFKSTFD